jgi:DNA polymerase III subunit epsilon
MREIVLDTETTGLSPARGDRVVEIGCVELLHHLPTGNTYHMYLNPERDMPEEAFKIHGLSGEFLSDKSLFGDIAEEFLEFISDATLVIHNAPFDLGFLNWELKAVNRPAIKADRVIDSLVLARKKFAGASSSLDALCRRFHIDNSNRVKHGALLDSELLAEVYLELIGGAQPHLTLISDDAPQLDRSAGVKDFGARPAPLKSRLTTAELEAHNTFLLELGEDIIWKKTS